MFTSRIDIWEDYIYTSKMYDNFRPYMNSYLLEENESSNKRSAVLICPGGGYGSTSEREAEPVALRFNEAGFNAFVLHYSVAPRRHPQPILDISRAMCIIRENAEKWNIHSDKIAVCGFSAGGHLAASLAVHHDKDFIFQTLGIKSGMNHPNALILSYPVITSERFAHLASFKNLLGDTPSEDLKHLMSLEKHVSEKTPPTFLWHTFEDQAVPIENSLVFAQALRNHNVPFELHIYPDGPHGLSLATGETAFHPQQINYHASSWIKLCFEWLDNVFGLEQA